MNKQAAITEMRKGNKITHRHFSPSEWMTMKGNRILLEDGVNCFQEEFWQWRTDSTWDDGYSLFTEPKNQ